MIQADAIFFKDPLLGKSFSSVPSSRQIMCLIVAAVLLQYFELAIELVEHYLPAEEVSEAKLWIKESARLDLTAESADLEEAAKLARLNPENAGLISGSFVDRRRERNDVRFWNSKKT